MFIGQQQPFGAGQAEGGGLFRRRLLPGKVAHQRVQPNVAGRQLLQQRSRRHRLHHLRQPRCQQVVGLRRNPRQQPQLRRRNILRLRQLPRHPQQQAALLVGQVIPLALQRRPQPHLLLRHNVAPRHHLHPLLLQCRHILPQRQRVAFAKLRRRHLQRQRQPPQQAANPLRRGVFRVVGLQNRLPRRVV